MLRKTSSHTRLLNNHKVGLEEYYKQESMDTIIVECMVTEAVNEIYIEELEDEYTGYSNQKIFFLIQHLKDKWYIMTTLEKNEPSPPSI